MIYLIDDKLGENSHSGIISKIINDIFSTEVCVVEIPTSPTYGELYKVVSELSLRVTPSDIVLCPWAVDADNRLDSIFDDMSYVCYIVTAAGNNGRLIDDYSPARADGVITVGCLNKSGIRASCSNFSESKRIEWVVGTSYTVDGRTISGTSVSSAIYAALLVKSILLGVSMDNEKDKYNNITIQGLRYVGQV